MTIEIKEIRVKWQNSRQALLRADYNHADEELARVIYFADHNPIISNILNKLRYGLIEKGYSIQVISYLNGQIDLLNKLITKESFNVENRTVYKGSQQCYNEA